MEDETQFEIRVPVQEVERAENMIREIIAEQERELHVESNLRITKRQEIPAPPAKKRYEALEFMTVVAVITVVVLAPFAAGFFKKLGENLADYVTRRLKKKK